MILLGVSGSIAAYKAVDILRLLQKAGQDVHVMMTPSATQFVGPLTFQSLSGHPVVIDVLDPKGWGQMVPPAVPEGLRSPLATGTGGGMAHLDLPEKAAAFIIAPASAQTLAQLAIGGAGDIVTASALAMKAPVFLAPAMHDAMWKHPATQTNVKTLKRYRYRFIGPEKGPLGRVGDSGIGRMSDPSDIVKVVLKSIEK
jgi:phosphopantothenoylcysteine decarboxylase/phosphopantothenate--cysteine ligase